MARFELQSLSLGCWSANRVDSLISINSPCPLHEPVLRSGTLYSWGKALNDSGVQSETCPKGKIHPEGLVY